MEEQTTTTVTELQIEDVTESVTWDDAQVQELIKQINELTEIETQQLENQLLMTSQNEQQLLLTFVIIAFIGFLCGLIFANLIRR